MGRLEDEETYAKSKLEAQGGTKGQKVLGLAWDCVWDFQILLASLYFILIHEA